MRSWFIHAINLIFGLKRAASSHFLDAQASLAQPIAAIATPGVGLNKFEVAENHIEFLQLRVD